MWKDIKVRIRIRRSQGVESTNLIIHQNQKPLFYGDLSEEDLIENMVNSPQS